MKVLLFGATGMVGQSVLRECLFAPDVSRITSVSRSRLADVTDPRLEQIVHADMAQPEPIAGQLRGHDACFFCLGVSSVGMDEPTYRHLTYGLTMAIARMLARDTPAMSFAYVSGAGTDSSEQGSRMWARVKGKTENDLLKLPFSRVFLFRPGVIQPLHAVRSKTRLYQAAYVLSRPLLSTMKRLFPNGIVTSEEFGRAMLNAARHEPKSAVLEVADIVRLGRPAAATD
ncbi:MAG TPA: NAD(P)H-binding protein [Caldimonas sp.]|nr:NAD(P)H-binding protein [Caldimonas sp.]HEX4234785.1 NAD(P)H-binding protein [Caldimonas sp.]